MIRINLLGAAKSKKGKKPVIEATGGVSSVFAGTLIMLALAIAINVGYYMKLQRYKVKIDNELQRAEIENRRLSEVRASYVEREKVKDNYKRRVDVIDELRKAQLGPVALLNMIGDTVNSTDEVWLSKMTDEGPTIELKGTALSVHGVADLMQKLQNTGYFKTVELHDTFQDTTVKEMQAFTFSMTCERAAQAPSEPAPPVKSANKS